mmetsp:Transcript_65623/g.156871  ORF Transcript_65623/g.156871 Transcript_65623/m.156871 type:complete len:206 (-) Transcript_65623:577-1194(-)
MLSSPKRWLGQCSASRGQPPCPSCKAGTATFARSHARHSASAAAAWTLTWHSASTTRHPREKEGQSLQQQALRRQQWQVAQWQHSAANATIHTRGTSRTAAKQQPRGGYSQLSSALGGVPSACRRAAGFPAKTSHPLSMTVLAKPRFLQPAQAAAGPCSPNFRTRSSGQHPSPAALLAEAAPELPRSPLEAAHSAADLSKSRKPR